MNGPETPNTLKAALGLAGLGVSVLRMKPNHEKRPDGNWKDYQTRRATNNELGRWFAAPGTPIGIVTGAVSGNLVMAEIEGRAAHQVPELEQIARDSGLGEIWDKVNGSWVERSPSGGIHWFYRTTSAPAGNQKLAQRPATAEELAEWKQKETAAAEANLIEPQRTARLAKIEATTPEQARQVLTETRAEGGYVVVAPTDGRFHETGRPWEWINTPDHLVTLTDDEAAAFLSVLRILDVPKPDPVAATATPFSKRAAAETGVGTIEGTRPGDAFDDEDWDNILQPHGWTKLSQGSDGTMYWRRPGKNIGISATTNHSADRERMYVFTTSTELPAETPLTKFAVYAVLNHGGQYAAAASELRAKGWGQPKEIQTAGAPPRTPANSIASGTRQDNPGPALVPPTAPSTRETYQTPPPSTEATVTNLDEKRAERRTRTIAHTDDGNASLFVIEHNPILRFNSERGRWLRWENTVWREDGSKNHTTAYDLARQTARGLPSGPNETDRKWKVKSLSAGALTAMVKLAATDPQLIVHTADLDNLPFELNTPAGPVDLKTGQLLEPDPEKYHTKSTTVSPDFDHPNTRWLQFLAETFPNNQPMIDYIQRLAGYTMIGKVREHIVPFGYGTGGNGKGVLIETLAGLLGDYAVSVKPDLLMKQFGSNHPTELATLAGVRMAVASEINPSAKFDEARLNMLSGGDKINARYMNENEFTFTPTHQLWLSGNHQPQVEGGGADGFWRRLRLIPFQHKVPEDKTDEDLKERFLEQDGPGILAWMIRGAVQYWEEGLRPAEPLQVTQATEAYQKDAQTVLRFLESECEVGNEDHTIPKHRLINAYKSFCEDEMGVRPLGGKAFAKQLRDAGVDLEAARSGTVRFYGRVRLLHGNDDQVFKPAQDFSPGAAKE